MEDSSIFSRLICGSFLLLLTFSYVTSSKLFVYDEQSEYLRSSDFDYPNNNETLNVIWLFNHSIRLHLNEFHLNGHGGDFVLVSDLPLLNAEYFKLKHNTSSDGYDEDLAKSVVTDQGLLLSWKVTKTIEAINERGTFVLFHSEAKDPTWNLQFKGFDIEVENYDDSIATTTTATPDPYVPPKEGQENIYISKFLNCKEPIAFYRDLDYFKRNISVIATEYCKESDIPHCGDRGDIKEEEVNVPGSNEGTYAGLHYCDITWEFYLTCVEITFAIIRTDNEGNYIFTSDQLEKMWAAKSHQLVEHGYCPYNPPKGPIDLNTVVWIAFFLGIIFSLTALLGLAWIKNTRTLLQYRNSFRDGSVGSTEKTKEVPDDKPPQKHFDERNPIYNIIPKSAHARDDHLYPSGDYLQVDDGDNHASTELFKKRSTDNPTFEHVKADVYAYDNTGFEQEENQNAPFATRNNYNEGDKLVIRPRRNLDSVSDTDI